MTATRPRFRKIRFLAVVTVLSLGLSSCALFQQERVAIRTSHLETLPPTPIAPGATVGGTPGSRPAGPSVVFQPGSSNSNSGKANYASDDGVTANVIRLGTIQPMDGPAAQLGRPLYRTTQAYVNALNARGGIGGRRVELYLQTACINCDDENKLAAQALVEQKHVFAVVNSYMNTYAFSSAMRYLNAKQVPVVQGWTGVGTREETWDSDQTPWSVYYTVRNTDAVRIYANWMRKAIGEWQGAGKLPGGCSSDPWKVGAVFLDNTQDERRVDEFEKAWRSLGAGYEVVSKQRVPAEEEAVTRMGSYIAAMRDAGACGVFSATNITLVFGMQAARRASWLVPWVSKSAWGRAATDNCGSACDGGFTDNNGWGWPQENTPQMRQYHQTMDRYFPDATDDAQTLGGWIGMMAFEYAAGRLGADLTRRGLMGILTNLRNFETGIGATINTSSRDHLGMGETSMLQICGNRFYRAGRNLSARSSPPESIDSPCGWGWAS